MTEEVSATPKKPKQQRYFLAESVADVVAKPVKVARTTGFATDESGYAKLSAEKPKPQKSKPQRKDGEEVKPKLPAKLLAKYSRGAQISTKGVKTTYFKNKVVRKELINQYAQEQTARAELLLTEDAGCLEADEGERTADIKQHEIVRSVDLQSAAKHFKLQLEFGPYKMRYTANGRHLLLGGRRGHVAALDWTTKRLLCEFNATEEVADVQWLHVETLYAVAQKRWTYIYDNKGTELHCMKRLNNVNCLEFLPYHFLLACGNNAGYLSWLDISLGEIVGNYNAKLGPVRHMRQNPYNATLCVGDGRGVVSMWSPKVREPLAKLLCHPTSIAALTVEPRGQQLVTAGHDRHVKVWDIRQLSGPINDYTLRFAANQIEVSQRGILAFSQGNYCELYQHALNGVAQPDSPYLRYHSQGFVHGMRFCPYEDVLGISTSRGFESLLVPGAGEPNYDALEQNIFQTRKQRRENEVHKLLEKIQPELITLDPYDIAGVDVPTLQEKVDAKAQVFFLKPPQIDFNSRRKMKGRGGTVKAARNKQIVKDQKRKEFNTTIKKMKSEIIAEHRANTEDDDAPKVKQSAPNVLSRFEAKPKRNAK